MRWLFGGVILFFVVLTSCNSGNENTNKTVVSAKKVTAATISTSLGDTGTAQLVTLMESYYLLKDAFVASDAAAVASHAGKLADAARTMQGYLLSKAGMPTEQKPFLDTLIMASRNISGITDNTCEHQRLVFDTLSSAIFGLLKNVRAKNANVYREYCPMAFNEKGAFWLSNETEIKNPYFGKKMLECGEVTDSL
jgi:Protein of unknown function (DUF3347)